MSTRYFVRTFKRDAEGTMKTVEILELYSRSDALAELANPPSHIDGVLALAIEISDAVAITPLGQRGDIPAALVQLYGLASPGNPPP